MVVHLGFIVAIVAIAWSQSFRQQTEVTLRPGQTTHFAGYTLRYDGSRIVQQPFRTVFVASLAVLGPDGQPKGRLIPSLNLYPSAPTELIATPSISKGTIFTGFRDLYASLQSMRKKGVTATFRLFLNPGVFWLWFGGGVMVLGGIGALWPGRRSSSQPPPTRERVREPVGARG